MPALPESLVKTWLIMDCPRSGELIYINNSIRSSLTADRQMRRRLQYHSPVAAPRPAPLHTAAYPCVAFTNPLHTADYSVWKQID